MKDACLCLAWLALANAAVLYAPSDHGTAEEDSCNVTIPWTVSRKSYDDITDSIFSTLMQCPRNMHGCSEDLISCVPATYAATCSCAPNCRAYKDCCWNVPYRELYENQIADSSCVEVQIGSSWNKFVYMVTGCPPAWPDQSVRDKCEMAGAFNDTFYLIPVTSVTHVTYRNGFCALCNEDIINATFWNTTTAGAADRVRVVLPDIVESQPPLHLRPCSEDGPNDNCTKAVPEWVSRRCKTYYAPVQDIEDPSAQAYRNVYCAMCNGANISTLTCSPPLHLSNVSVISRKTSLQPPNLAALFKPVVSTASCYVEHDGHCYIKNAPTFYSGRSGLGVQVTFNETTTFPPETPRHEPTGHYKIHNYITVISMSVSICCLVLKIFVFCIYKESRSFSSKCTLCLSVTLLFTQLLFLVTSCQSLPGVVCASTAVLIHYGFLCTFLWTTVLSYDIWRSVTAMKLSSMREKTLAAYGMFAWGVPTIVVLAAVAVQVMAPWSLFSPSYGNPTCWIGTFWGLIVYFLIPMATLLLLCMFFYFSSVFYIRSTSAATCASRGDTDLSGEAGSRVKQQRYHAALFARLALIMGAAWAIAFLGTFMPYEAIDSIVNALVGLQGAYLFFAFKDYHYLCSSMTTKLKSMPLYSSSHRTSSTDVSSKKSRLSR
ncbi:hypothetical protein HPB50_024835 [Hyalomma asiaticum]|uniref:Uncharacterized protein n=1 Tax=Hyalomma asiaticum TaxID=266040 RepID=A0ACB7TBK3_HYAAI|nr:hypothetical protein HPB50_024835 [Hyalomma asiaticum]